MSGRSGVNLTLLSLGSWLGNLLAGFSQLCLFLLSLQLNRVIKPGLWHLHFATAFPPTARDMQSAEKLSATEGNRTFAN